MISSSLLLTHKISVPYRNRTYNRVLGGPRYIHLTKGTNAVLGAFQLFLQRSLYHIISQLEYRVNKEWPQPKTQKMFLFPQA